METVEKTPPIFSSLYKGKVEIKFFPDSHIYMIDGKRKTGVTSYIAIKDKSAALVSWAVDLYRDYLLDIDAKGIGCIAQEHIYRGSMLHRERKTEAAEIGNKIHDWCEAHIKHQIDKKNPYPDMPEDQAVQVGVNAFLDWEAQHKPKYKSSERLVYSKKYDYVGTLDIEAVINKKLYLIDLKSSNGLYNTVNMQTAAYVFADEEESGRDYQGRWAIRLAKETEQEYIAKMRRKQQNDLMKGRAAREIEPYKVFEAKELLTDVNDDFKAFLACKTLHEWDKRTDYYLNK